MTYFLTEQDLTVEGDNTIYVGDLEAAKKFILSYSDVSVCYKPGKGVTVYISQDGAEDEVPNWSNCNEFGNGETEDQAWRFALGAAFGPLDSEFHPFPLTTDKKELVEAWAHKHFNQRLDYFYSEESGLGIVQGIDGDLWMIWPDGTIKRYWEH